METPLLGCKLARRGCSGETCPRGKLDTEQPKGEGGFVLALGILQLVRNQQHRQVKGCFTHYPNAIKVAGFALRACLLPSFRLLSALSLSPPQLYNVGVGWRSWESGIPCSPRSSQGNSSLVVSSLGPPQLLWGRGGKEVLEKPLDQS